MKLWKVTVNCLGRNAPRTYYYESREEAERDAAKYPAHDAVEYAGQYADANADRLLGKEPVSPGIKTIIGLSVCDERSHRKKKRTSLPMRR